MTQDNAFQELMVRVRAGDEAAAKELVDRYESKIAQSGAHAFGEPIAAPF